MDPITSLLLGAALAEGIAALKWRGGTALDAKALRVALENAEIRARQTLSVAHRDFLDEMHPNQFFPLKLAIKGLLTDTDGSEFEDCVREIFRSADPLLRREDAHEPLAQAYIGAVLSALAAVHSPVQMHASRLISERSNTLRTERVLSAIHDAAGYDLLSKIERALHEGKNRAAELLLEETPARADPATLAKFAFHRARLELRRGNKSQAARLYLEAARMVPDDPVLRAGAVTAYTIMGDSRQAAVSAKALVADFPRSTVALAHALDFGLLEVSTRLAAERCLGCGDDVDLRIALALSGARERDWDVAIEHAASATLVWGDRFQAWLALAQVRLDRLLATAATDPDAPIPPEENVAASEVHDAADCAVELLRQREDVAEPLARALTLRGIARRWKGDLANASADFAEAFRMAPEFEAGRLNHAQCLLEAGKPEQCVEILEKWESEDQELATFALAHALLLTSEPTNLARGANMLGALTRKGTYHRQHEAVALATGALSELGRRDEALSLLDASAGLPIASERIVRAWLYVQQNLHDEAKEVANEALLTLQSDVPKSYRRQLAVVLGEVGEHEKALPLWKALFDEKPSEQFLRNVVACSLRAGADDVALEAYRRYRELHGGEVPSDLVYHEARLRMRPDPEGALNLVKELVQRAPQDRLAKLRLSTMAHELGRQDLVASSEEELPSPEEISSEEGRSVALLFLHASKCDAAIDYAYRLLRAHHNSSVAHATLRDVVLMSPQNQRSILDADEMVTGTCAVRYQEDGDDKDSWAVLQERPIKVLDEHSPDSDLAKQLLGKRVGDEFVLSSVMGVERRARIQEICSKYLHRFRTVMESQGRRFPEDDSMVVLKLPKLEDGSLDFAGFLATIERQGKRAQEALQIHREQLIPMAALGRGGACGSADALLFLLDQADTGPRCALGTLEEQESALRSLVPHLPVVVDTPALLSVFFLEAWALLERPGLIVGRNALTRLAKWNDPGLARIPSLHQLRLGPEWVKNPESFREQLQIFLRFVEAKCKVEPALGIAAMPRDQRERLDQLLGEDAVEALALAKERQATLWTDDLVTGLFGAEEFGLARAWTQAVCLAALQHGQISAREAADVGARLLGWCYRFTGFGMDSVVRCGELADWKPEKWPLQGLLQYLKHTDLKADDACTLCIQLLRAGATRTTLPEARKELTLNVVEALAHRKGGVRTVLEIRRRMAASYGLGYLAEREVVAVLDAWLAASHARVEL